MNASEQPLPKSRQLPWPIRALVVLAGATILFGLFAVIVYYDEQNEGLHSGSRDTASQFERIEDAKFTPTPASFSGSSANLRETAIMATLEDSLPKGRNAIWCSTVNMGWNRLRTEAGSPIVLAGAEDMCRRLNIVSVASEDIAAKDCFIGLTSPGGQNAEQVLSEFRRRFPGNQPPKLENNPLFIQAVVFLDASQTFTQPFRDLDDKVLFHSGGGKEAEIKAFGIPKEGHGFEPMRKQVRVLFRNEKEYALDLSIATQPYQVIVSRQPPSATLGEALQVFDQKCEAAKSNGCPRTMKDHGSLAVPTMSWAINHSFAELQNKWVIQPERWRILEGKVVRMDQETHFRLDRSGAYVRSVFVGVSVIVDGDEPTVASEEFPFNRPFLLIMKKRDHPRPFLVMWIDNAELLIKK